MTLLRWHAAAWLITCFAALALWAPVPTRAALPRQVTPFAVTGMVAVGGNRLLIWHRDGRAQWHDPKHGWSSVWPLPVGATPGAALPGLGVLSLVADPQGVLVLVDWDPELKGHPVVLLGFDGVVQDRWLISAQVQSIASDGRGRHALLPQGAVALQPQGLLGLMTPLNWPPSPAQEPPQTMAAAWWPTPGLPLVCRDAHLGKQGAAPVRCQQWPTPGWDFQEGAALPAQPVCGPWLLVWRQQGRRSELVVRATDTGRVRQAMALPRGAATACLGGSGLLVATPKVRWLGLPELTPRRAWPQPGLARVRQMAVLDDRIACVGEGQNGRDEVVWLPRADQGRP